VHLILQTIGQFLRGIAGYWRPFLEFMADVFSPIALVGVTCAIFYVSHGQWYAFQQQLEEMRKTSQQTDSLIEIAKHHAEAAVLAARLAADNQRPILSLEEAEVTKPLVFGNGARTAMKFIFGNKGRTAAEDAHFSVTFFPQGEGRNRRVPGPEQKHVCREATAIAEKSKGKGFRIGSNGKEPREYEISIRGVDLQRGLSSVKERTPGLFSTEIVKSHVQLLVVGCVDYKFQTENIRRQMQFVGSVVRLDGNDGRVPISPEDKSIGIEELRVLVSSNPLD
jgi:hypothetical protein